MTFLYLVILLFHLAQMNLIFGETCKIHLAFRCHAAAFWKYSIFKVGLLRMTKTAQLQQEM